MPTEPEGMSRLLVRLSTLALVTDIVTKAKRAIDAMSMNEAIDPDLRDRLARSQGLFVAPDVLPGALITSGACNGVFMARAPGGEDWYGPTFHLLAGVVLGHGPERCPVTIVLVAMSDRGVSAFLSDSAGFPGVGGGEAPEILGFVLSRAGCSRLSLDNAVITTCDGLNRAVYGRDVTSAAIIRGTSCGTPPAALAQTLIRAAGHATKGASRDDSSSADSRDGAARRWLTGVALRPTGGGEVG
jgi:lipid-binding SYLF domain-containing protein